MERTTLVRTLKPLQNAGFVVSGFSETGRSLTLTLSRQGIKKLVRARPLWDDAHRDFEALFGVAKAKNLRAALRVSSTQV
jgi:DNA-binding MarR family transcriptional regulator